MADTAQLLYEPGGALAARRGALVWRAEGDTGGWFDADG